MGDVIKTIYKCTKCESPEFKDFDAALEHKTKTGHIIAVTSTRDIKG